jgi:hypothetical protein
MLVMARYDLDLTRKINRNLWRHFCDPFEIQRRTSFINTVHSCYPTRPKTDTMRLEADVHNGPSKIPIKPNEYSTTMHVSKHYVCFQGLISDICYSKYGVIKIYKFCTSINNAGNILLMHNINLARKWHWNDEMCSHETLHNKHTSTHSFGRCH